MKPSRQLSDLQWCAALCVVATIPLEISKLFLPALGSDNRVDGRVASSLDIARLALLAVLVGVAATRRGRLPVAPRTALGGFVAAFTVYAVVSWAWSAAPRSSAVEGERLLFLTVGFGALVAVVTGVRRVERYSAVIEWTMVVVALGAIAQRALGVYLWNHPLAPTGRVNVTYADPNILARHLTVGVVLVAARREPDRGRPPWDYLAMIGVLFGGLLATGSRSSLVAAVLGLAYVALRTRRFGSRWPTRAVLAVSALGAVVFVLDSGIRERFATLLSSKPSLGPRPYLLRAGWNMFLDHPLGGVGLGAFQTVYRTEYREFFSYYGAAGVASHTSAVTVLAELGVVGILLVGCVVGSAYARPAGTGGWTDLGRIRCGFEAALTILLLTSQSEGRLIEDPMFWVVLAGIGATDRVVRSRRERCAQGEDALGGHPATEVVGHVGWVEPPLRGGVTVE